MANQECHSDDRNRDGSPIGVAVSCLKPHLTDKTTYRENCRLQLGDLSGDYGLGVVVVALPDLVVKAMRLPAAKESIDEVITSDVSLVNSKG